MKEMLETNILKYKSCKHAKAELLSSKVVLAEATTNVFWGSGLLLEMTIDMLSDYWPGKNNIGKILVLIREDFVSELQGASTQTGTSEKLKATSPLEGQSKSVKC